MKNSCIPISTINGPRFLVITLVAVLCSFGLTGLAQTDTSSPAAAGTVGTGTNMAKLAVATNAANQFIQEQGQAAVQQVQTLWQRIDEKRLKNRTPDEIVAMVIMGALVGGLLYRFGKRGQVMSIVLGMVGAFLGGIIANIAHIDLGLGPVLITYEELFFSLLGGVLLIVAARWAGIKKMVTKPVKPTVKPT
jgi:uncharacterized membrane protein YeaQ/YmgE (transglycosylase-associated protein family)